MRKEFKPFNPINPSINFPIVSGLKSFFSKEECLTIRKYCEDLRKSPGAVVEVKRINDYSKTIQATQAVVNETRRADTAVLELDDKTEWMYKKIHTAVKSFNNNLWNFDISYAERLEYLSYPEGSYFNWHYDVAETGHAAHRKLIAVIQLSDKDEYEGGELDFFTGSEEKTIAMKEIGSLIIFPTYIFHKVSKVLKGKREALICVFLSDKPFK